MSRFASASAARDLLGAQLGEPGLPAADLGVQLVQAADGGLDRVVLDTLVVPGQARRVGVEVAVVGEHEHVQLGEGIQCAAEHHHPAGVRLALPHLPARDEVVADDRHRSDVAARRHPGRDAREHVGRPLVHQRVLGRGLGQHPGVGDPHRGRPRRAGPGFLGVGRPHLDLGAVDVAGQDGPLVGDHPGCDAERQAEHRRISAAVTYRQRVERRPPAVLERLSRGIRRFCRARTIVSAVITIVPSLSSLGATAHPVRLAFAWARPVHHSAARPIHGAASRIGPYDTDTAIVAHMTMSATTLNGTAIAAMCFSAMPRKMPIAASTANRPSPILGTASTTLSGVSIHVHPALMAVLAERRPCGLPTPARTRGRRPSRPSG